MVVELFAQMWQDEIDFKKFLQTLKIFKTDRRQDAGSDIEDFVNIIESAAQPAQSPLQLDIRPD